MISTAFTVRTLPDYLLHTELRQTDTSDLDTGFYNRLALPIINMFRDKVQRLRILREL